MKMEQIREQARKLINDGIDARVEELKKEDRYKNLEKQVDDFVSDPFNKNTYRETDDYGYLMSTMPIDISEFIDEDKDVIYTLIGQCSEMVSVKSGIHRDEWEVTMGLGEFVRINFEDRGYAVYSSDLNLKVNYYDLTGENEDEKLQHAKLIIEQASRKAGVFPYVCRVDRYGQVYDFETGLGTLDDAEIDRQLKEIEDSRE